MGSDSEEEQEFIKQAVIRKQDGTLLTPEGHFQNLEDFISSEAYNENSKKLKLYELYNYHGKKLYVIKKSLYFIPANFFARKILVWIVSSRFFEIFIMLCIVANSIFMAMYDYNDRENQTEWNQMIEQVGSIFTYVFLFECGFKIIAQGFALHHKAYLRDGWNVIDFIVVATGILEIIPGLPNLKALRTVRVLRPLRSIKNIPSMRRQVTSLIISLPALGNVVIFLLFIFMLFGILGVQSFGGFNHYRCRTTQYPDPETKIWPIDPSIYRNCALDDFGQFACPSGTYCGHPAMFPGQVNYESEDIINNQNIQYGIVNFDNIFVALLTIFQIITLEGWTPIMYNLMDSNLALMVAIFFCILVLVGSFFLLNLILAVIMGSFTAIEEKERKKLEARRKRKNFKGVPENEMDKLLRVEQEKKNVNQGKLKSVSELVASLIQQNRENKSSIHTEVQLSEANQNMKKNLEMTKSNNLMVPKHQIRRNKSDQGIAILKSDMGEDELTRPISASFYQIGDAKPDQETKEEDEKHKEFELIDIDDDINEEDQRHSDSMNSYNSSNDRVGQTGDRNHSIKIQDHEKMTPFEELEEEEKFSGLRREKLSPEPMQSTENEKVPDEMIKLYEHRDKFCLYKICFYICTNGIFNMFITFVIVANTVVLALDRYPIDLQEFEIQEAINLAFYIIFSVEMVIKMLGLGLQEYVRDKFNIFDCAIVMLSTVEVVMQAAIPDDGESSGGGAISAFRGFRLLRIFKLAKSWKEFQKLLTTIGKTLKDISNFSVLLFLFMFVYTLLGMELFAYKVKFNDNDELDLINGQSPRVSFNTFPLAFTTIFIVLTGEDWNFIMYQQIRGTGGTAILFFVTLVVFGQLILLNLFLAILLRNFDEPAEQPPAQQEDSPQKFSKVQQNSSKLNMTLIGFRNMGNKCCPRLCKRTNSQVQDEYKITINAQQLEMLNNSGRSLISGDSKESVERQKKRSIDKENFSDLMSSQEDKKMMNNSKSFGTNLQQRHKSFALRAKKIKLDGKSLGIFPASCQARKFIAAIVETQRFDSVILLFIVFSSILLAVESPLMDPNSSTMNVLSILDYFMTAIFILESVIKIIAKGFLFNGKGSYLRTAWNILDFIIVVFSIISIFANNESVKAFKVFRLLRILRPLRVISRNEGLKVAVQALLMAIPSIGNVTIISTLFFLIFGIMAVNYFKGKMMWCEEPLDFDAVNDIFDCYNYGGYWYRNDSHFDNIFASMMTLFEMSTTEGWVDVMIKGMDQSEINQQPVKNQSWYWSIFFIIFIIIGSFFILNLFVGVVISTFNREKDKLGKNSLLTKKQREWLDTKLTTFAVRPKRMTRKSSNRCRAKLYEIALNKTFEYFIMSCIILNTVTLMVKFYDQPESVDNVTDNLNFVFAGIFTLEAIVKIVGLGPKNYFRDGWNRFDFLIVIGTFIGIIIGAASDVALGPQTTIIRSFRISRIFRLVNKAKSLKVIFNTFIVTIPALANVGGLLILLLYLYSILGMFLFGKIKLQNALDHHSNFQNFHLSFLTLLRSSTGEAWNEIMHDTTRTQSLTFECTQDPSFYEIQEHGVNGCGDATAGFLFFFTFLLVVTLIFLNLFIAIILQGFNTMNEKQDMLLAEEDVESFRDNWAKYDPDGNGFLPIWTLPKFLIDLGEPLGLSKDYKDNIPKLLQYFHEINLPTYNCFRDFHFWDVLQGLSRRLLVKQVMKDLYKNQKMEDLTDKEIEALENEIDIATRTEDQLKDVSMLKEVNKKEEALKKKLSGQDEYTSKHLRAGTRIMEAFKNLKIRKLEEQQQSFGPRAEEDNASSAQISFNSPNKAVPDTLGQLVGNQSTKIEDSDLSTCMQKQNSRISNSSESQRKNEAGRQSTRITYQKKGSQEADSFAQDSQESFTMDMSKSPSVVSRGVKSRNETPQLSQQILQINEQADDSPVRNRPEGRLKTIAEEEQEVMSRMASIQESAFFNTLSKFDHSEDNLDESIIDKMIDSDQKNAQNEWDGRISPIQNVDPKSQTSQGFFNKPGVNLLDPSIIINKNEFNQTSNKWRKMNSKKFKVEKPRPNQSKSGKKIIPNSTIIGVDAWNIQEEDGEESPKFSLNNESTLSIGERPQKPATANLKETKKLINEQIESEIGQKLFPEGRVVTPFMIKRGERIEEEKDQYEKEYEDLRDSLSLASLRSRIESQEYNNATLSKISSIEEFIHK